MIRTREQNLKCLNTWQLSCLLDCSGLEFRLETLLQFIRPRSKKLVERWQCVPDRIVILLFEGRKLENQKKNPERKNDNQQQLNPHDAESGNRT